MLISLLEFVSLFKRLITTQIIQITPFSSFSFPVIAVMFTFSFNTAFADVSTGLNETQQAAYDAAVGPSGVILNAKFEAAWAANKDHGISDYLITTKAYAGLKNDALEAVKTKLYDTAKASSEKDVATLTAELVALYGNMIVEIVDEALGNQLAQAQFAIDYATEVAKLDTVDVTAYSTETYSPEPEYTHQEKAAAVIAAAKKKVAAKAATINSDSTVADCLAAWLYVNSSISKDTGYGSETPIITKVMDTDGLFTGMYELTGIAGLKKSAEAEADKAVTEAEKAAYRAEVAKKVAEYQKDLNTKADAELVAAYKELYEVRIESGKVSNVNQILDVATFASTKIKVNYNLIQDLVAYAEKYKAERDAEGNLVRDAEAIDKIVKEAKKAAYNGAQGTEWNEKVGNEYAKTLIESTTLLSTSEGLKYAQKTAKTLMANYVADKSFYDAEKAKVDALVAEYEAKIDAEKDAAKVKALYNNFKTTLNGLKLTKDEVNTGLKAKTAYSSAKAALVSYIKYYNSTVENSAKLDGLDEKDNAKKFVEEILVTFYGEKGARTESEMKALKDEILTLVEKLPTAQAQADAKKAAQDAIDALPAVITLADETAVKAAVDAVKAYEDVQGTDLPTKYETALNKAKADLYNAYRLDLSKKYASLVKTDKAAVKALIAEYDAAQAKNKATSVLSGVDFKSLQSYKDLLKLVKGFKDAEKAAVKKAINAIPVNVTEADKATVVAARKLYDAYVAEYTDYETEAFDGNAANDFKDCYRELALAEATLGLNAEDPALAVKSMKLRAYSKYAKKGITVKWVIEDGRKSDAKGYQVWRSTKANTGYKKLITVNPSYGVVNAKNLKKGVTYYYKVRAYNRTADGKLVFSDWSNKAYRKAK